MFNSNPNGLNMLPQYHSIHALLGGHNPLQQFPQLIPSVSYHVTINFSSEPPQYAKPLIFSACVMRITLIYYIYATKPLNKARHNLSLVYLNHLHHGKEL